MVTRRGFPTTLGGLLLAACARRPRAETARARLRARPGKPGKAPNPGSQPLGLRSGRDAILYVPESVPLDRPAPLLVYLHGATGNEQQGMRRMAPYADEFRFILLSPSSEAVSWDAIQHEFGPDVRFVDRALERVFKTCSIDPRRIGISGFSDGATYALGLGLSNGDLFTHVMALSPGFIPAGVEERGRAKVFVSHGTADQILPIDQCSRQIVPRLKRAGYEVRYLEFDGPHSLTREISEAAMRWFLE